MRLGHDQMLETINFCSNGDIDLAFSNLHRTRKLMEKCYWLNFDIHIYGEASGRTTSQQVLIEIYNGVTRSIIMLFIFHNDK